MPGITKIPAPNKPAASKGQKGSQQSPRIPVASQNTSGSRNNSPIRNSSAQKTNVRTAGQVQGVNSVQSTDDVPYINGVHDPNDVPYTNGIPYTDDVPYINGVLDSQGTEDPTTPSDDLAKASTSLGTQLLAELQDCSIEEVIRELTPRKSETSPARWAKLYEGAKGYNSLMRWYDGPGDDSDDGGEEPLSGDNKGKTPISGQESIPLTVEPRDDRREEAGPSGSQVPGGQNIPGTLGQGEENEEDADPDAITKAPFLPEVPADEFGRPIDMLKNPPPNEYTKSLEPPKKAQTSKKAPLPIPKTIRDDPYAYPGSHPHRMRYKACGHESNDEVVCEELRPQKCRYNLGMTVDGLCDECIAAGVPDPTLSRSKKIRRSIKGVGSWLGRTARTIARSARRKPIPENMRQNSPPPDSTGVEDQRERVDSPAEAGPSGTPRSYNQPEQSGTQGSHSQPGPSRTQGPSNQPGSSGTQGSHSQAGASGAGSASRRTSQGGDGQSAEGRVFEGRGPAPGTAGLPLPNQQMTPQEQETLRRLRGPTASSVGAGGADPTIHVDDESDKS
ncbi:hypothetical protein TWF506_006546 [Arthrobotrys conoides]|uniref:Uncharacterized protein n=1 Tax=Arthrobotrys conoides TaxID=74498 RepID=A0AAN8RP29_9PEZI